MKLTQNEQFSLTGEEKKTSRQLGNLLLKLLIETVVIKMLVRRKNNFS